MKKIKLNDSYIEKELAKIIMYYLLESNSNLTVWDCEHLAKNLLIEDVIIREKVKFGHKRKIKDWSKKKKSPKQISSIWYVRDSTNFFKKSQK